ncbi:terminase large subunit [Neorhizobium alkalisoli]|uniref:Phage terminase large subunit-like protein n=1 Tax=Neorhizobium alkalisoli TaxID=528178 RepID=A0A561QSB2_9HYPH|nr:terminase large subunit [Neorhizobium alkalisoli]TWF53254.1 phage terminase large subunit-like protein [Neorhizobium alkalisoli]
MEWSTACPDWEQRIVERKSLVPFEPLFPDEAEAALAVFKSLRIVDVAGQPTFGEACEAYVFDFVRAVFGAYDHRNAKRLIEEFFLLISKKNIKSTLAAGIMLTALIRNWRHSAELLIVAPTLEIAGNSFKPAADMVRADPELVHLLHVQDNLRQITHLTTNAVLKVVSADASTVGGKKAAFVLVEELWLFGKRPGSGAMLQEATGGLISRPEGFVIYISTQSDEVPAGVFKERLEYFRDVRDGKISDPRSLPVLYEFPDSMIDSEAYLDPANFYVTNPNMGRSVSKEWLERKLLRVKSGEDEEGDTLQSFLAKHLNIEIGMRLRKNRWPGANYWEKAGDEELSALGHFEALERLLDRSEVAVVGFDGGGLDDLAGLNVLGREPAEIPIRVKIDGVWSTRYMKRWLSWSHAWCHRGVLDRRKKIAPMLSDFSKAGELTIVDDALEDVGSIIEIIQRIKDRGLLGGVAADAAGLGEFIDALEDIEVSQDAGLLVAAPQGYGMMNALKSAERRVASGLIKHCGGILMPWCISNLKIEPTATAIRATKQTAGDAKIDPAMAFFNSVTLMARNPTAPGRSVYETRGIRMI